MAYINQDGKKRIEPKVKEILKRYGVKGTLSIRDFSTLTLKVKSGKVDFDGDVNGPASGNYQVNPYHFQSHFGGGSYHFLKEVHEALNAENYDTSDRQTDYFDVGYYVQVQVGAWNKPYEKV